MKIKPRKTNISAGPIPKKYVAAKKRASPRGKTMPGDGSKVQIQKVGPLCPVWGARTQAGAQIKSWRVWVLWVDGDWTCETMKSFSPHQVEQIQQRVRRGTDIWPWPEGNSPKDMYRRNELKGRNMHHWQDAASGKRWISIPQNERQDDDDDKDLPNEKDSLFMIQAQPAEESTTETADSDDSTDDDEEEDEI